MRAFARVKAGEYLADSAEVPAVLSYLAPVQFALQGGAPSPTSDAEVKALYVAGLNELPPEFRSFLTALVSEDANLETAVARYGLTAIAYVSSDDFDESAASGRSPSLTQCGPHRLPSAVTLDPFSQELIFGSSDEFQTEILRLFASAGLIILLVLAIVFLVRPSSVKDRRLFIAGVVLMIIGASDFHRARTCAAIPRCSSSIVGRCRSEASASHRGDVLYRGIPSLDGRESETPQNCRRHPF